MAFLPDSVVILPPAEVRVPPLVDSVPKPQSFVYSSSIIHVFSKGMQRRTYMLELLEDLVHSEALVIGVLRTGAGLKNHFS